MAGIVLGLAGVDRKVDEDRIYAAVHAWFPDLVGCECDRCFAVY